MAREPALLPASVEACARVTSCVAGKVQQIRTKLNLEDRVGYRYMGRGVNANRQNTLTCVTMFTSARG